MQTPYQVHESLPPHFKAVLDVAACYCEHQGKFLFLKRQELVFQGNLWCVPAGKWEKGETIEETALRELREETGLVISEQDLISIRTLFVELPEVQFNYHMYHVIFDDLPEVQLNQAEHVEALWLTLDEAQRLSLIAGEKESLLYVNPRY